MSTVLHAGGLQRRELQRDRDVVFAGRGRAARRRPGTRGGSSSSGHDGTAATSSMSSAALADPLGERAEQHAVVVDEREPDRIERSRPFSFLLGWAASRGVRTHLPTTGFDQAVDLDAEARLPGRVMCVRHCPMPPTSPGRHDRERHRRRSRWDRLEAFVWSASVAGLRSLTCDAVRRALATLADEEPEREEQPVALLLESSPAQPAGVVDRDRGCSGTPIR